MLKSKKGVFYDKQTNKQIDNIVIYIYKDNKTFAQLMQRSFFFFLIFRSIIC